MNPLEEAIAAVQAGDRGGRTDGGSGMATTPRPTMDPIAFHGPAGEAVRVIEPHTEADPVAILATLLAGVGAMIGSGPRITRGGHHPGRLFVGIVGDTARGGKGQSLHAARLVLDRVRPEFMNDRVHGGFGSGEAVIDAVADPDPDGNGGSRDRRLLVIESELSRVIVAGNREGSTLSQIFREAWDGGKISTRSRTKTAVATNPHICIVGHVAADELRRNLTASDVAGGFANRFLWIYSRRDRLLPHGKAHDLHQELTPAVDAIGDAITNTRTLQTVEFTPEAADRYGTSVPQPGEIYYDIETDEPGGLLGNVITRGSPFTLRLALLFALLDGHTSIGVDHLEAGYAVWRYARESAEYVFGDAVGDQIADQILAAVRRAPDGMTLTDLTRQLGGHVKATRRDYAVGTLERLGKVTIEVVETGGRSAKVLHAV